MSIITSKRKGRAGFTLVEAMVAIAILSISITGPLVIAQKGIASAVYSRDQVTAFYLAQEAVEYVRNARDTNRNNGLDWKTGLGECVALNCTIDATQDISLESAIATVASGPSNPISLNKSSGLYGYSAAVGWTPTLFRRLVSISSPAGAEDREIIVSVKVSWSTTLFAPQKEFSVKEILFNI
jgi:prepilin-type N-terminal cleavage/methylation domain-containing protein